MPVVAGDDRVADADVGAGADADAVRAAHDGDVADREDDPPRLGERGGRRDEGDEGDEPGNEAGVHRGSRHLKS